MFKTRYRNYNVHIDTTSLLRTLILNNIPTLNVFGLCDVIITCALTKKRDIWFPDKGKTEVKFWLKSVPHFGKI